jgi:hypothetical protein
MTKNDLIQMAYLAGYDVDEDEVYAPASGRYGLDPRLEHFAKLVAGYALRYECRDVSTKEQNSDTSEECVPQTDKVPWDTFDMAHRSGGLTVDVTDLIQKAKAEERQECAEHYLAIMRDAVAQAVKREREVCAKLCEESERANLYGVKECATAIRGRKE